MSQTGNGRARRLGMTLLFAAATLSAGCGKKKAPAEKSSAGEVAAPAAAAPSNLTTWGETAMAWVGQGAVTTERLQRYLRLREIEAQRTGRPAPTALEVLEELVNDELLVQQAIREGMLASDDTARQRLIAALFQKHKLDQSGERPTDEVLRSYYESHRDQFPSVDRLRMRHILLRVDPNADDAVVAKVKAVAERVRAEAARAPADKFGEIAKKHSEDPSAVHGGELGFLPMDRWLLVFGPDFAAVSIGVKDGEVGPLVRSTQGFHVFQVVERKGADADPLEVQRREILSAYMEGLRSDKKKALLDEAKKAIEVRVVGDPTKPLPVAQPPAVPMGAGSGDVLPAAGSGDTPSP